jgi:cytochrome c-type biogenesis protein CcmH/NrfF
MKPGGLVLCLAFLAGGLAAQPAAPPEPIAADPLKIIGPPLGQPVPLSELDGCTKATAALLRCPVCQGLSVNDSPASLAVKMRAQVRELHQKGYTEEQILTYFEKSYGEFVRLEPPLRGVNWLVWLAPVLGLAFGGWLVTRVLSRSQTATGPVAPGSTPEIGADPALQAYLERARGLARGDADAHQDKKA